MESVLISFIARRGYQRFIEEALKQGHDKKYYQTLDQRFLGEESFVQEVPQRTEAKEIEIKGKRASCVRQVNNVLSDLSTMYTKRSRSERMTRIAAARDRLPIPV